MKLMKYEMVICWSEEDDCYLVGFPDFPGQKWRTHGNTYEVNGELLPEPRTIAV
jgi:antitoxin HicB